MIGLLGYSIYWDLPVLIVVVSLVYSATRYEDFAAIGREAFRWGQRMVVFLGSIAVGLFFLSWWLNSHYGWWMIAVAGGIALALIGINYRYASNK